MTPPRPVRLRLSRAKGFNLQAASVALNGLPAVNCARPGPYGNPYVVGEHGSRIDCVRWFICLADNVIALTVGTKEHFETCRALIPNMRRLASGLRGHNLACWCTLPKPGEPDICHCTVWLALANDDDPVKALRPFCDAVTIIDDNARGPITPRLTRAKAEPADVTNTVTPPIDANTSPEARDAIAELARAAGELLRRQQ